MTVNRRVRIGSRLGLAGGIAALLVTTLVLAPATSASAARGRIPTINCLPRASSGTLASGPAVLQWGTGYLDVNPTGPYWSVIASRGSQLENSDIGLYDSPASPCNVYKLSADTDIMHADWVAFDNNSGRLPITTYAARYYNAGKHMIQFVAGHTVLATTLPTVDQPMGLGDTVNWDTDVWIADIRDVWLIYESTYTFTITGEFSAAYILHSNSGNSDTWTRTKTNTNASAVLPDHDPMSRRSV